jgi:hypothetical protein
MSLTLYLFVYPVGHCGLTGITLLVILPLTQVIETFLTLAIGFWLTVGADAFAASSSNLTRSVGALKVKLSVLSLIQSASDWSVDVATTFVPASETTLMVAEAGDVLKPYTHFATWFFTTRE